VRIDKQTLADLDIFRAEGGGPGLFTHLDRTRTFGGRTRLAERFRSPPSDPTAIREIQESLGFLSSFSSGCRIPFDDDGFRGVTRYLALNYSTARWQRRPLRWVEGVLIRMRYPDLYRETRQGVELVSRYVDALRCWCAAARDAGPPPQIGHLVDEVLNSPGGEELMAVADSMAARPEAPGAPVWWWRVTTADHLIRKGRRRIFERFVEIGRELDALVSMAIATTELGYVFPEIVEGEEFRLAGEGLFHPFLADPVANDVNLGSGRRLLFLTGPNMAGKTTYLKTCGVAAFLAHLGMGVPASRLEFTPASALKTSVYRVGSLRSGVSFFYSEVLRISEVVGLVAEGETVFALFDEVFLGTNVLDAMEATEAVVRGLCRAAGSGFIVSSHLVDLTSVLSDEPAIALRCFEMEADGDDWRCSYQLRPGSSAQRIGLRLLEREGVFEMLNRLDSASRC
jgi:DNA mismatch repair ATPase MutS